MKKRFRTNKLRLTSALAGWHHRNQRLVLPQIQELETRRLFSVFTVNTLSDASNPGAGLMSLRQAVAAANSHGGADTITFDPKVFAPGSLHTILLQKDQITFSDKSGPTTVTGPGAAVLAVSGNGVSRIFNIGSSATVSISGLTGTNGFAPGGGFGGAIYSVGNLTLTNVTVTKSSVLGVKGPSTSGQGLGGGIFSSGNLALQSCVISFNTATGASNVQTGSALTGLTGAGGGIYSIGASVYISQSSILSNTAVGGAAATDTLFGIAGNALGGGINASVANISGCTISSNTAQGGTSGKFNVPGGGTSLAGGNALGGGINVQKLTLSSSTLSGNGATGGDVHSYFSPGGYYSYSLPGHGGNAYGGAVMAGSAVISSSVMDHNEVAGGQASGIEPDGGVAGGVGAGGGLYAQASVTLAGSTISNNTATGAFTESGQGSAAQGGGAYCKSTLSLVQSVVSGNAAIGGEGVASQKAGGQASGGGLVALGAFSATDGVISGNKAVGGDGEEGIESSHHAAYAGAGGRAIGGGAECASTATLTNCTLAANSAVGGDGGGAISYPGPSKGADGGAASGGAIYGSAAVQLLDSTVSGNFALGGAGGASATATYPDTGVVPGGHQGAAAGGGIVATAVHPLLRNSIASANKANGAFNDISGILQNTSGFNLIGVGGGLSNGVNGNHVGVTDPKLSNLGNYGGPVPTMFPMAGSPVIDAGSNSLIPASLTTDQRGAPRIIGKSIDIGADEYLALRISGNVFKDINADGKRQSNDPPLGNWQVYIDLGNLGHIVSGDPSVKTDSSGNFSLTYFPLTTKTLSVREIVQSGWRRTDPAGIDPAGSYTVSATGGTVSHLDFGNSTTALISGSVFNDAKANGNKDSGETTLANFRVYVDSNKDGRFESNELSALSDSAGNWTIGGLTAGNYLVRVASGSGWQPTVPANGAMSIVVASGQTISGKLFGEHAIV